MAAHLDGLLPWFSAPQDETHAVTADRLLEVYLLDADVGDALARLPWVAADQEASAVDGLSATEGLGRLESLVLDTLLSFAETDTTTTQILVALPWVADGVTEVEWQVIRSFALASEAGSEAFAQLVAGLPWVGDDVSVAEQRTIGALFELKVADAATAQVLVAHPWIADDVTEVEQQVIQSFASLADADGSTFAGLIVGLPWVGDNVTIAEQRAIEMLLRLGAADEVTARLVVAFSWLADGITEDEVYSLRGLLRLADKDGAILQLVTAFPWMEDLGEPAERTALYALLRIADADASTARLVATLPWLADGLIPVEMTALNELSNMTTIDTTTAQRVMAFSWLTDDVTYAELRTVEVLSRLARVDAGTAQRVAAYSWVGDDITDVERWALHRLAQLAEKDLPLAQRVATFPWVGDGIADIEGWAIYRLNQLAEKDLALAQRVAAYPWVGDNVTEGERWAITGLDQLAERDLVLAERVVAFPWVGDDITDAEQSAITALVRLTEIDLALAQRIGSLSWLADSMTHAEGWAIISLADFAKEDPELARTWLGKMDADPSSATTVLLAVLGWVRDLEGGLLYDDLLEAAFIQSRTVSLPLAGEVNLWAFQTAPSPEGEDLTAMMEEAVRATEELMGAPFPVTDVIMAVPVMGAERDHGIPGGAAHWGRFISVTRKPPAPINRGAIHHEVGHYYFGFGPPWLVEGGAEFAWLYTYHRIGLESLQEGKPAALRRVQHNCLRRGLSTIQQLNERQIQAPDFQAICHYSLGAYLLLNLYETLGEAVLSAALRDLYLRFQGEPRPVTEEEFLVFEEEIYEAFLRNTPPELVDAFHEVYKEIHGRPYAEET